MLFFVAKNLRINLSCIYREDSIKSLVPVIIISPALRMRCFTDLIKTLQILSQIIRTTIPVIQ